MLDLRFRVWYRNVMDCISWGWAEWNFTMAVLSASSNLNSGLDDIDLSSLKVCYVILIPDRPFGERKFIAGSKRNLWVDRSGRKWNIRPSVQSGSNGWSLLLALLFTFLQGLFFVCFPAPTHGLLYRAATQGPGNWLPSKLWSYPRMKSKKSSSKSIFSEKWELQEKSIANATCT